MEPHELDTEALREKTKANTPGPPGPRKVRAFWGRTVRGRHHTLADDSSWSLHVWFTKSFLITYQGFEMGEAGFYHVKNPDLWLLLKPEKTGPRGARLSQGSSGLPASAPQPGPFGSLLSPLSPAVFLATPVFSTPSGI